MATTAIAAKYSPLSGISIHSPGADPAGASRYVMDTKNLLAKIAQPTASTPPGAASPDPSASGSISTQGTTPDWKSLISGDVGLQGIQGQLAAANVGDLASRNAAIRSAYVQFGSSMDLKQLAARLGMSLEDVTNALGSDAQQLAQDATASGVSTEARLKQANAEQIRKLTNDLNRRGILNSGETGYQLDKQATGFRQSEFDARNQFLQYLQQYQQGYLAAQSQRSGTLATAYSDAANRQYGLHTGTGPTTATFAYTDSDGNPVYKDESGIFYDSSGKQYTGPGQAAPTPPGVIYDPRTGQIATGAPRVGEALAA